MTIPLYLCVLCGNFVDLKIVVVVIVVVLVIVDVGYHIGNNIEH